MTDNDRILIWGVSAVGGTVGAFLKRAGHDVTFVRVSALHPYTPPSSVLEILTAEFDAAWEERGLF